MSGEGSLVIRVKRRRSIEPLSSLCVVEESSSVLPPSKHSRASSSSLADALAGLSTYTDASGEAQAKSAADATFPKLILDRIGTLAPGDRAAVEAETIATATSHKRGRAGEAAAPDDNTAPTFAKRGRESYVLVTCGRKAIRTSNGAEGRSGYSSYVVVDMSLVESKPSGATAAPTGSAAPAVNGLVLDPLSRRMDAAIAAAASSNDFAPMVEALKIGADPRYAQPASRYRPFACLALWLILISCLTMLCAADIQNYPTHDQSNNGRGGLTALMASALQANTRMIGTLLARGASALTIDASGRTALELLRPQRFAGDRRMAGMQALLLLQNATVKEMQLRRARR